MQQENSHENLLENTHENESTLCNFIDIAPQHEYSPVSLLHIFRTPLEGCFCFRHFSIFLLKIILWLKV